MEIKERLKKEMVFKLSDTTISSRLYNHWVKIGIVNDNRINERGWRYFTITDIVWIEIVLELRSFGLESNKIKKVKKLLLSTSRLELILRAQQREMEIAIIYNGVGIVGTRSEIHIAKESGIIAESYLSIDIDNIIKKVKNNIKERHND